MSEYRPWEDCRCLIRIFALPPEGDLLQQLALRTVQQKWKLDILIFVVGSRCVNQLALCDRNHCVSRLVCAEYVVYAPRSEDCRTIIPALNTLAVR